MAIYLKTDGITGSVSTQSYKGTSELLTARVGSSKSLRTPNGNSHDRDSGASSHRDFTITKLADSASSDLQQRYFTGKVIPQMKITLCRGDKDNSSSIEYTLHDVLISHIDETLTQGGQLVEGYGLNYTKLEKRYTPHDSTGRVMSPKSVGYDLTKQQVM